MYLHICASAPIPTIRKIAPTTGLDTIASSRTQTGVNSEITSFTSIIITPAKFRDFFILIHSAVMYIAFLMIPTERLKALRANIHKCKLITTCSAWH